MVRICFKLWLGLDIYSLWKMSASRAKECIMFRSDGKTSWIECVPSGEVMVEESGVPVQDDWSMAPDEERVRFSLSGVTPH